MVSKPAALLLSATCLMGGCKGFWNPPSSSSGGGSSASSGDFYVLNLAKNQIAGYDVNKGSPTALTGSPYSIPSTLGTFSTITVAPNNNFLYVSTANGIFVYTIASNGALTIGNGSGPVSPDQAISMQVSPGNNWLLDVVSGAPYVYAIPIDSSTGKITSAKEQLATLPASTLQQVRISPDGSLVIAAMGPDGTATIPFNQGSSANPFGAISRIAPINSAGGAISVAFDPLQSGQTTPRLFYVGETAAVSGSNSGGLRAFNFSTQAEISGSPFATLGLAPYWILPIASGSYVYVANRQVNGSNIGVIAGYSIASNNTTYTLTALSSTASAGTNPVALAEDSTGNYVFAVDYGGNPDLKGYTFDSTTAGKLDAAISTATGTDPVQAGAIAATH